VESPDICIPDFFTKPIKIASGQPTEKLVSPLNCWHLPYPEEVLEKLSQPVEAVGSRLVGTSMGVYWLVTQSELYLWNYDSIATPSSLKLQRIYEFKSGEIRALAVGHLDFEACSIVMPNKNRELLVIGFESFVELYSVDIDTLELSPMEIKVKMISGEVLEKLEITNHNELVFTGDQGFVSRVGFEGVGVSGPVIVSNARPSTLGYAHLFKPRAQVFTENILATKNGKIYVLIRKET
jgi:hypothetical protein